MRFLIAILLVALLAGCLKTTDPISPDRLLADRESKPVVVCFISPQDSVLAAKVAMSEPKIIATFESTLLVKNAVVTLSNGPQTIRLDYDDALGYYRTKPSDQFRVRAGETYRLTVRMGENRQITAQATVPESIPLQRVGIDSLLVDSSANQKTWQYTVRLSWNSPGGTNYYRGWGRIKQTVSTPGVLQAETRISQPDFMVEREIGSQPGPQTISGSFSVSIPANARIRTELAHIALFTTDENYYRYHATLREQLTNTNPFLTNATPLFSNIDGGFGVFAAYNGYYMSK
ncbi:DUF4249 domain-containing protein [Spirosoma montaniterrae]|uniref:DUF4249 domain-containing protein n=1 Tax=Spirosoma montaniterrae TaxID=1178516 RepID=A0A1P9WXB4_9BACT|nr:DUF4249 domain-containing protein [Spirosoma montaniterrae]AQG80009.1 hypothetical protein AWR27_12125 [Spirosoma montaniterrae]